MNSTTQIEPTEKTLCQLCHEEIKDGELVVGFSWNGEGGQHLHCPKVRG